MEELVIVGAVVGGFAAALLLARLSMSAVIRLMPGRANRTTAL